MKLLFDARWIKPNSPDGLTRYSRELIKELSVMDDVELSLLVTGLDQASGLGGVRVLVWNSPTSPLEPLTAYKLRKYRFDSIYSPHFIFGSLGKNAKLVLTVMDFIPFRHKGKGSSLAWRIFFANRALLRLCLVGADSVASISQTSLKELSSVVRKPTVEIPCASSLKLSPRNRPSRLGSKRLLYIGRYEEYKGVEVLIRGMESLGGYTLVLAGNMGNDKKKELASIIPAGAKVDFIGRISDEDYSMELGRAFAAVSASTDEGFGLPILEAMRAGVPVVCSGIDVFREVSGRAALYFSPQNPGDLASHVMKLEDEAVRSFAVSEGMRRAERYSWSASAKKLKEYMASLNNKATWTRIE